MAKTHHANKEAKKKPALTPKEKKAAKHAKQSGKQAMPIVPKS